MIAKRFLWLLSWICLFSVSIFSQEKKLKLSVMTYNIRHAGPPSKPVNVDVDTVAAVIKKYQPDVVALQEVDVHTKRSGQEINQAKVIGEKLNMYYYFSKAIDFDGGEYGVAILSKYPFDSVKTYKLPSANNHAERRVLALAYLRINSKTKMLFACTHMDAETGDASRLLQMKAIDSLINLQTYPAVLTGDLNYEPGSTVINLLDQQFKRSCMNNCSYSFPSDKPKKTIDFITYRKSDSFRFIRHRVLQEPYPSDHLPVLAELQLSLK